MKGEAINLYKIKDDVECIKCGNKGAVQFYGKWYESGLGDKAKESNSLKKFVNKPFMNHAGGLGGNTPYRCLNCGNTGLIDVDMFEGFNIAFRKIKK